MYTDDIFDYIFKRRACRNFKNIELDKNKLQELQNFINEITPIDRNIKTVIKIVENNEMKGIVGSTGLHNAPYYINFYSETNELAYLNCGFMLQQIDLYLSKIGLGSCYVGMAKPKFSVESELDFIMTLAVGEAVESIHRNYLSEFKRKTLIEILDFKTDEITKQVWQAVKLAPSAVNLQPWFFDKNNNNQNEILVYCKKNNMMKILGKAKMSELDIGIALCHLAIACHKYGYGFKFESNCNIKNKHGYYPIGKVITDL